MRDCIREDKEIIEAGRDDAVNHRPVDLLVGVYCNVPKSDSFPQAQCNIGRDQAGTAKLLETFCHGCWCRQVSIGCHVRCQIYRDLDRPLQVNTYDVRRS